MSFLHGAKFSTVTFTNKSFASPPPKSSRPLELANPPCSERGTVEEPLPSVKLSSRLMRSVPVPGHSNALRSVRLEIFLALLAFLNCCARGRAHSVHLTHALSLRRPLPGSVF